ncbi:hypothetical protein Aduo_018513 [Ancylostoma duodenale]
MLLSCAGAGQMAVTASNVVIDGNNVFVEEGALGGAVQHYQPYFGVVAAEYHYYGIRRRAPRMELLELRDARRTTRKGSVRVKRSLPQNEHGRKLIRSAGELSPISAHKGDQKTLLSNRHHRSSSSISRIHPPSTACAVTSAKPPSPAAAMSTVAHRTTQDLEKLSFLSY